MSRIIVVSGFSGSGKGSIIEKLLENNVDIWLSVSDTERERRNATDRYTFITSDEFQLNLKKENYIEYNRYGNHFYGSPRKPILEKIKSGYTVLLEIDIWGKRQIEQDLDLKRLEAEIISVFIAIDANTLKSRLLGRGDCENEIQKRMQIAREEARCIGEYDYVLINYELSDTVRRLESIIRGKSISSDVFDSDLFREEIAALLGNDGKE